MKKYSSAAEFITNVVKKRDPHQPQFHQAVNEVLTSLWPFIERNPKYGQQGLMERFVEPERIIQFRVPWVDDKGVVQVNRGWRVQFNSAIGPYKGGMRLHPTVNLSVLKFLAFEQTLKNSLTTLPIGGGKGGSDFNPKGKSDGEVMRFCQSLVSELYRHIGPSTDVPAGDIGVGPREIGYMNGMYWKLTNTNGSTFTGKALSYQGSEMRPEATGYGLVYFVKNMLKCKEDSLEGKIVGISGSGNVAQYTVEKCLELGAKVVTVSDSTGFVHDSEGFTTEKLAELMQIKNVDRGCLSDYASAIKGVEYHADKRPWGVKVDVALPCACENELDTPDAKALIKNGVTLVAEGANMPTTEAATEAFREAGVLFAPGKASNAGGVAMSALEMSQNAMRMPMQAAELDTRLAQIMASIHSACVQYGDSDSGVIDYVNGANVAGFVKVADAMLALGVI